MAGVRSCGRWSGKALAAAWLFAAVAKSALAQTPIPPSAFVARDIGAPALAGSASLAAGVFTIDAAGADIWGTSDQFHFVYQPIAGDVDISARIDALTAVDGWTKAGVMIRKSLAAGSAHAFALVTAGYGTAFQRRASDGAESGHTAGPSGAAPRWVRLVRAGTRVTAYASSDGAAWTTIGSATISLGSTAYVGLAVTSHNTGARTTARMSRVGLAAGGLPAGQQARDIGAPAISGSTVYQNGVYTTRAAGADIWDVADQFHFISQPITGDVEVVVRVASITAANAWSKAGVMIRESLTAGSRHASAFVSSSKGYAFQRRLTTGGQSSHSSGGAGPAPGWLRLVRTGSRFEAFRSSNGTTWTSMGADTIAMGDSVYVGIAATSHDTTSATTVVADSFKVIAAPSANQPPSVTLTSPAGGATFTAPATVNLTAAASDPDGPVVRVDFFRDGVLIGSDTSSPYSGSWSSAPAGTYTLTAVAYDGSGASTTSNAATITVSAGTPAPTAPTAVAFQASADHATVASYRLDVFASGANPATAAPVATADLGKPAPATNNDITVNRATFFSALAAGTYQATVTAISPSGSSRSTAVTFTR